MFGAVELRLAVVLVGTFILPGWAVLALGDGWRRWRGLQRWIVAVGISIAFYPVLFYVTRSAIPFLTFGPYKMGALLLLCAVVIVWRTRGHWREQFTLDRLEWVALAIFGTTLFTRLWIVRDHPYPAWSDSLHHTLLTQLTAVQGRLPFDMQPYFPIPLGQYHLGLYSLSATVQWLAQVPAHTALLWTVQALNGLCGLGVYLALDRKVGRLGAVVGAVVVGLWSHQPAWYVNWGRFTQVASQTIMLIAWLVTWEAIAGWKCPWQKESESADVADLTDLTDQSAKSATSATSADQVNFIGRVLSSTICAAVLLGATFLLHFRVAAFCVPLLALSIAWELWKARPEKTIKHVIGGTVAVGVATLVIVGPALWAAVQAYTATNQDWAVAAQYLSSDQISETMDRFYEFPWPSVPLLAMRNWLMVLSGLAALVGLVRRNKLTIVCLVWVFTLYLIGNAYVLGLPFLAFTNLGAILILFYLPAGLLIGSAVEEVLALCGPAWRERVVQAMLALVLVTGFIASHVRVTEVEPFRYFVTPEDVAAMDWIRENTPPDALFAVNTHFWLPLMPHGTDAGYWIPYFTGRQITAGVMLLSQGTWEYGSGVVETSRAVERLEVDNAALAELRSMGVDYVYIGQRGDFAGSGLNAGQLSQAGDVKLLYQNAGVSIFQIEASDE
jgi:hypothetical protein